MFAMTNGIQSAFTDAGEGLPMVFIHGFPLSRGAWSKQVEAFQSKYRVIAPDLRGFGESGSSVGPVFMSRYAGVEQTVMLAVDEPAEFETTLAAINIAHPVIAARRAKIVPGIEVLPLAAQHDRPHGVVVRRPHEGRIKGIGHLVVLRIAVPRTVHADHRHRAARLIEHGLFGGDMWGDFRSVHVLRPCSGVRGPGLAAHRRMMLRSPCSSH